MISLIALHVSFYENDNTSLLCFPENKQKIVFSYNDVMKSYYDDLVENYSLRISFDEYSSLYYRSGMSFANYNETLKKKSEQVSLLKLQNDICSISNDRSSSPSADYILEYDNQLLRKVVVGQTNYEFNEIRGGIIRREYLKRLPSYNLNIDYSTIYEGSFFLETNTPGSVYMGHCGIIYKTDQLYYNNEFYEPIDTYTYSDFDDYDNPYTYGQTTSQLILTAEAVGGDDGKVWYGFMDDTRIVDYGVVFFDISIGGNYFTRAFIKDFFKKQIRIPYFLNLDGTGRIDPTDWDFDFEFDEDDIADYSLNYNSFDIDECLLSFFNGKKWYCSEILDAAATYAGCSFVIDNSYNTSSYIFPYFLFHCYNAEITQCDNFVEFYNNGKSNNKWQIVLYNRTSQYFTIYYNYWTCSENNAKNWTNLNYITSITLNPWSVSLIEINDGGGDGYIVLSHIKSLYPMDKRYITYAHLLNVFNNTYAARKNIVNA